MPRSFDQIIPRLKPGTNVAQWDPCCLDSDLFHGAAIAKKKGLLSFSHVMTLGMSPKKIHEVERMSKLVVEVCKAVGADTVVDIGAGEGYVSHVLSQHYGYRVIAVEGNEEYSQKGAKRVSSVSTQIRKQVVESGGTLAEPHFMVYSLTNDSIGSFEAAVQAVIKRTLDEKKIRGAEGVEKEHNGQTEPHNYVIIGLHTCGDLAIKVIDLFLNSPHAVGLVVIGCCYQLTTSLIGEHSTIDRGTPFSIYPHSTLLRMKRFRMGWGSLKVATESCHQYSQKKGADFTHVYRSLSFRAILELILRKYYPEGDHQSEYAKEVWQSSSVHPDYRPGNRKGSGHSIDCRPKASGMENQGVELSGASDIKVRFRFKKLRQSCYVSEKNYLLESCKRFIFKTEEDPNWRPVDFGAFALFQNPPQDKAKKTSTVVEPKEDRWKKQTLQDMLSLFEQYRQREREVAVWTALQMVLNPLLESLVLLDRLLYIEEFKSTMDRHVCGEMLPLFDVVKSPRNMALIAQKVAQPNLS